MNEFLEKLKIQAIENPLFALGIGAAAVTALSKLLNAGTERKSQRTWDKEVNRRVRKSTK